MLKKIMKAALAASLVFGMSSFAYAQDFSVGGKFRSYFGQYSTGAEDYTAHWDVREEANVKLNGKVGKLSVYHEMESATDDDYKNTQTKLSYVLPFGQLSIGNQTSIGTIPKAGSGWSTSNIPNSTSRTLYVAGYSENEGLGIVVPLEGMGFVQFIMYEDSDNLAKTVAAGTATALGAAVPTSSEGTGMQLGADLKFGGIGVRLGYASAATDDPASADDEAMSTSNMMVGASVPLGETMSIAFDYASATTSYDAWADDLAHTNMGLAANIGGIGPGKLVVFYAMETMAAADPLYAANVTSLMFDAPVGKGAGVQLGYIARTYTPEGGDGVTESFMGGGLYASF